MVALQIREGAGVMSLEERTSPYAEAIESNLDKIMEISRWLKANPHAHPELRRQKLKTWRALDMENDQIDIDWQSARERWISRSVTTDQ